MKEEYLEHSHSEATRPKIVAMTDIFEAEMRVWKQHRNPQMLEPFGVIDLYGGPGLYPERDPFVGSPIMVHRAAATYKIDLRHTIFEIDDNRAAQLRKMFVDEKRDINTYQVIGHDNSIAPTLIELMKKTELFPEHGIIVADPDGAIDMKLILALHKLLPSYSLLMNVNCSQPKRTRGRKPLIPVEPPPLFIELMAQLPSNVTKYMTRPKSKCQWTLVWVQMPGAKPLVKKEALSHPDNFIDFNTAEAFQTMNKLSLTIDQLKEGHTILSPFFQHIDIGNIFDPAALFKKDTTTASKG